MHVSHGRKSIDRAKRAAIALPVALATLELNANDAAPLYRQLYRGIQKAIASGDLASGSLLPPTRVLAEALGLARATVVAAFDQLIAEGYLTARVGHGTRVAHVSPEAFQKPADSPSRVESNGRVKEIGRLLRGKEHDGSAEPEQSLPFWPGVPDLRRFPQRLWARHLGQAARLAKPHDMDYSSQPGHRGFREAIGRHVHEARGIRCNADQIIVTSGARSAFAVAAEMALQPGDSAYMEEPGSLNVHETLAGSGATIYPMPIDEAGANPDRVQAPDPKLIYVTPSHQFPLGFTMTIERRLKLLAFAERCGAFILEDDYDSEFRFEGRAVPALHSLDPGGAVLYVGTFSKTMYPAIRVGYLIVPEALIGIATHCAMRLGAEPPRVVQRALATFMAEGHYAAHIRRMRISYGERHAILAECQMHLPSWARLSQSHTGGQNALIFPAGVDDRALAAVARQKGLGAFPLSLTAMSRHTISGFLLGFSHVGEKEIAPLMRSLSEVLTASAPDGRPPRFV